MRIEGKLTKWNDDRGFGFITPTQGGPEVFVHVSALPKEGHRPTTGERLTFEIEVDREGKKRASHVFCPDQPAMRVQPHREPRRSSERSSLFGRMIKLLVLAGIGFFGYQHYTKRNVPVPQTALTMPQQMPAASANFRCDDRIHCSQMTSCAEAKFFLRNCPGTQMDGDGDGIPCEQQWCN
jgi:cold shock CspA family protein